MKVVKVGGSLEKSGDLSGWLQRFQQRASGRWIIVPGGGVFADQVREAQQRWQFDERTAHAMAVLAMAQSAWLIQALLPEAALFSDFDQLNGLTQAHLIWQPELDSVLNAPELPASWHLTSDSLAAWLTAHLDAEQLVMLKLAEHDPWQNLTELSNAGVLDPLFPELCQRYHLNVILRHPANWP
ncbi:MAG: uridylate kinase [Methylococcales bacterium]|nr:uridylate kinase [Methylococcales bacterium]